MLMISALFEVCCLGGSSRSYGHSIENRFKLDCQASAKLCCSMPLLHADNPCGKGHPDYEKDTPDQNAMDVSDKNLEALEPLSSRYQQIILTALLALGQQHS